MKAVKAKSALDSDDYTEREFPMTQRDFNRIKETAYAITGITLTDQKKSMIYGRISRRIRVLGMRNFAEYCNEINRPESPEIREFTNSITTNLTAFFREQHHFDYLKTLLIPQLIKENRDTQRLRVWSAGCSTGEEPYSIAMVLASFPELRNWDVKVLATDLDSNVVATAKTGIYRTDRVEAVPSEYQSYVGTHSSEEIKIQPAAAKLITFKQLNLLQPWPMKGPFDFIFCRNVVIYFDISTQKKLFDRYADMLSPNGHLFIGHSENLAKISQRFSLIEKTAYKKIK